MTRKDFAARIYWRLKMRSLDESNRLVRGVFNEIRNLLIEGHTLYIPNFGTFKVKPHKGRRVLNPRTGEPMTIPGRNVVTFRPVRSLRKVVDDRKL